MLDLPGVPAAQKEPKGTEKVIPQVEENKAKNHQLIGQLSWFLAECPYSWLEERDLSFLTSFLVPLRADQADPKKADLETPCGFPVRRPWTWGM